jgi:hypothetical protein
MFQRCLKLGLSSERAEQQPVVVEQRRETHISGKLAKLGLERRQRALG